MQVLNGNVWTTSMVYSSIAQKTGDACTLSLYSRSSLQAYSESEDLTCQVMKLQLQRTTTCGFNYLWISVTIGGPRMDAEVPPILNNKNNNPGRIFFELIKNSSPLCNLAHLFKSLGTVQQMQFPPSLPTTGKIRPNCQNNWLQQSQARFLLLNCHRPFFHSKSLFQLIGKWY